MYSLAILSNKQWDFVKVKTKEAALSSYQTYDNNVLQNLSKDDFFALQNSENKDFWTKDFPLNPTLANTTLVYHKKS